MFIRFINKIVLSTILIISVCTSAILANDLALGSKTKITGPIDIPIVPPQDFNFKPKAEIFQRRTQEVLKHKELLQGAYAPSNEVFGQIVDRKPWWGILGEGYYGSGQNSIKGPAEESRFILNPFLLAGEACVRGPDNTSVSEQDILTHYYPWFYQPSGLRWWPKEQKSEVTYLVSSYESQMCSTFNYSPYTDHGMVGLEAINARDLGLNYFYIPAAWAYNMNVAHPMSGPMAVPQFVHCGGSCGYPGGCNNMSPTFPPLEDIKIVKLPARLTIIFWKNAPTTGNEKPDMTYTMNFN